MLRSRVERWHVCIIPAFSALSKDFADLITPMDAHPCKRNTLLLYLSFWEFDEGWYLRRYPDLSEAVTSGHVASGWRHFASVGFFEGRLPIEPVIDGDWYLSQYGDVASAILDGSVRSARDHVFDRGRVEGRLPREPEVDRDWYADRFLPADGRAEADRRSCRDHFLLFGYLNGATPRATLW